MIRLFRVNHHTYTYTHLQDVQRHFTPQHSLTQDVMYPVYITEEVHNTPINDLWFKLTTTTRKVEGGGVSQVLGSEIGQKYVFDEETPDPEPP